MSNNHNKDRMKRSEKTQNNMDRNAQQESQYESNCENTYSWYGLSSENNVFSLSTALEGEGKVNISFGNCGSGDEVQIYLEDDLKANASSHRQPETITFDFNPGAFFEIKTEGEKAVIGISSFVIICKGRLYLQKWTYKEK